MEKNSIFSCRRNGRSFLYLLIACVTMFASCYNDDDLKNSISSLEDRVANLESSLKSVQSDIATLNTLLDGNKQIKSVVKDEESGNYTITFSDGTTVTIQGINESADVPNITVIKEENGIYYWGIETNGKAEYLKNSKGEKMPVTGSAPISVSTPKPTNGKSLPTTKTGQVRESLQVTSPMPALYSAV